MRVDPSKIRSMIAWPLPKSIRSLRGFLGLNGYNRKFVNKYGLPVAPLTDFLRNDAFLWSFEASKSFVILKEAMKSPLSSSSLPRFL